MDFLHYVGPRDVRDYAKDDFKNMEFESTWIAKKDSHLIDEKGFKENPYVAGRFWKDSNDFDPVKSAYRFLFAARLATLLISTNIDRSKFIMKIMPHMFDKRVRISTILALMNYNDFAYAP